MFQENSEPQQCVQLGYVPSPSSHSLNQPGQLQPATTQPSRIVDFHKVYSVLGIPCKNPRCPLPPSKHIPGLSKITGQLLEPIQVKDWHNSVPKELRNHMVQQIIQAIIPDPDPYIFRDIRMDKLREYARNGEGNIYQKADSRDEYYVMLAEKIDKIQKLCLC